jgi:hypothetical protein
MYMEISTMPYDNARRIINEIEQDIVQLNDFAKENLEVNLTSRAAFLRILVITGENLKYLKPDQPNKVIRDELIRNNQALRPPEKDHQNDFYKALLGGSFDISADIFKRLRDRISHAYVVDRYSILLAEPSLSMIIRIFNKNVGDLSSELVKVKQNIEENVR